MDKTPFLLEEPRSEQDHEALIDSYLALDEKNKVQILKNLKKHAPPMLQRIIRKAGLTGGVSQQRVIARFGRNGRIIDNWFKAPEQKLFFAQTIYGWLLHLNDKLEDVYGLFNEATHEVECIEFVNHYLDSHKNDSIAVVKGRFALAWMNFESVLEFNEAVMDIYDEELNDEIETVDSKILIKELDKTSSALIDLAESVVKGLPWDDERCKASMESAKKAVQKVRSKVEKMSEIIGVEMPDWTDRVGLESTLDRLEASIHKQKGAEEISTFLRDLASEIKQLVSRHRLLQKREKYESLRDSSASELQEVAENNPTNWRVAGPREKGEWLFWASEVSEQDLRKILSDLKETGFPKTAALVEDLAVFDRPPTINEEPATQTFRLFSKNQGAPTPSPSTIPKTEKFRDEIVKVDKETFDTSLETPTDQSTPDSQSKVSLPETVNVTPIPENGPIIKTDPIEYDETLVRKECLSIEEAAEAVAIASDNDIEGCVEGLIWSLLKRGERMLAWHTLKCAVEEKGMTRAFPIPHQLLEILALLPVYAEGETEVLDRVRSCVPSQPDKLFIETQRKENILRRLFLAATCFLPALLDKVSNASASLSEIRLGRAGDIRALQQETLEFAAGTVEINTTILNAIHNHQGWQEQLEDLNAELEDFRSQATHRKINYTPARQIWQQWFNSGGLFERLFSKASGVDPKHAHDLKKELDAIDIENEIQKAWKDYNYKGKGVLIGTALGQLRRYAEDTRKLLGRVADHLEMHGQFENDHRRKVLRQIVNSFSTHLQIAISDVYKYTLDEFGEDERGKISFTLLKEELERVGDLLKGKNNELVCRNLETWEGADFARIDSSNMETRLCPLGSQAKRENWRFNSLIQGLTSPLLDWEVALNLALTREDHQTARLMLDRMFLQGIDTEILENEKSDALEIALARAKRALGIAESNLGEALTKGWITAQVHQNLSDEVQKYSILLHGDESKDYPFNEWHIALSKIENEIRRHHDEEKSKIREKVNLLKIGTTEERTVIRKVLDGGDINLAADYLTQIEEEGALHPRNDKSLGSQFAEFFSQTNGELPLADKLLNVLTDRNFNSADLVKRVAQGVEICGRVVPETHRVETSGTLQNWLQISRSRKFDPISILELTQALGFPAKKIDQERGESYVVALERNVLCPVPDFGSILGGKLTIICDVSSASAENAIDRLTNAGFDSKPVLLFWFKPLDSATRRGIARLCHEKAYKILVVDSVLALHVLLNTDSRLRTLFNCALPFTSITPYSTTGGALADEMFVGRRREMRAIESDAPSGACFVYGGRQIGKSVLLQKVAKDFDDKTGNRIALYIDLTRHTVGTRETMEDVWRIMAEELGKKAPSIFKGVNPYQLTPKSFGSNIIAWLNQDRARRILLLLDEADALLTADGENEIGNQHFDICNKIRGLMAETERRFKVVFAGLHNVQRSTIVANNPLAQLGRPICIGPLMNNGEAREAFRLIEQPFVAAGVYFENHHVVNGILARTNYYPNLIQIVCSSMLSRIIDRQLRSDPKKTPPYMVQAGDVEAAFNNPDLRAELRKKFLLTLDLDKRYQLIAYIVAFNRKDKEEGMTSDEILKDARFYWEAGFSREPRVSADAEKELFQVLLEEMCGLGILRQPKTGIFCLRSPNVAELLGTDSDLETVLESAHLWEVTEPYAPETFRCVMEHRSHWRSPLTSKQETLLEHPDQPVIVVAGCKASGIDDLEYRVKEKFKGNYFRKLSPQASKEEFTIALQELGKRKEGRKTIIYVPVGCDWNFQWVEKALERTSKLTSNDRAAGVVFVADPEKVWQLGGEWRKVAGKVGNGYFQLRPWSRGVLKGFLKDGGNILNTAENIDALVKATGLWAAALLDFQRTFEGSHWQDSWLTDGSLLEKIKNNNSVDDFFGISDDERKLLLQELADAGDCDQITLAQYLAETRKIASETVAKVIEWATVMSIVTMRDDKLYLDLFVKSLLKGLTSESEKQA
jgi:hypothetical protein